MIHMQIDIQVINKDSFQGTTKKEDSYTYFEVTYKELKTNKTNSKKIFPFGDVPVFEAVKKFEKNDKYTIIQNKEGDYWNWKEVKPYGSAPAEQGTQAQTKSAYVPDDVKQRLIVRQSCLASASKIAAAGGMTHENAMEMAQEFVDWVFEVKPKQEPRKPKRQEPVPESPDFSDFDDDIPF